MSTNDLKNNTRVQYIEPTNLFEERDGSYSDGINYPYEDYCMAVDLTIEMGNRYSCGFGKETGEGETLRYSTKDGSISLMGGTRGYESTINQDDSYLTVNYTDISMMNPESNTAECLGIESISISYSSWFFPQVVIKFVDIRGATVLQPAEKNYYNLNGGNTSNIYKALFSFPYPIFKLKVKGFYGKGVTYKLAVEKTNMEFDANTGNFNIVANFIGYMYGVYADIPMTYLAVAPYTLVGKEYWDKKVAEGVFMFKDSSGVAKKEMMTIPELRLKLAEAASNEVAISAAAEGTQIKGIYDERKTKIGNLLTSMPFQDWFDDSESPCVYKLSASSGDTIFSELMTSASGFVSNVSGYDYTYKTTFLNDIKPIENYVSKKNGLTFYNIIKKTENEGKDITITLHSTYSMINGSLIKIINSTAERNYKNIVEKYDKVNQYVKNGYKDLSQYTLAVFNLGDSELFKKLKEKLTEEDKLITKERSEEERVYNEKKDSIIEEILGFRPSIRNIYELMFAHMDTFTHCFYSSMKIIKDELDSNSEKRKKSYYMLKDGETDTEREIIRTVNGENEYNSNERSQYLPPYTAFYKEEYTNNETKKVLKWPEEIVHGHYLEEVSFIKELLAASELYTEDNKRVDNKIEAMSSAATSSSNSEESDGEGKASVDISDFIPITTYDFINKSSLKNPYSGIADKVYRGSEEVISDIIGIFFTRMYYYQMVNRDIARNMAKVGQIEAINLFKAVKDKYTGHFCNFINDCVEKFSQNKATAGNCLNTLLYNQSTPLTKAWQPNGATNLNNNLFSIKGFNVLFNYHKGVTKNGKTYQYFPMDFNNFGELKKMYVDEGNLEKNSKFLALYNDNEIYKDEDNVVSTFSLIESRDYLENVIRAMESEIQEASKIEPYGKRETNQYGKLAIDVNDCKFLRNNILKFNDVDYNLNAFGIGTFTDNEDGILYANKVEKVMETGDEIKTVYIKNPTRIYFNGKYCKLFDHPFYKAQTDINVKACLFLQSLNYTTYRAPWQLSFKNRNEHMLKAHLLFEGSMYWLADEKNRNLIIPKYKIEGDNTEFEVKIPEEYEVFIQSNVFSPILKGKNSSYVKWKEPSDNTASRRKVLKEYFLKWVNSTNSIDGFKANEAHLRNESLYEAKSFSLSIKNLVASEKMDNSAIQSRKLQDFLRDLFLNVHLTLDLYNNNGERTFNSGCDKERISMAFYGFFSQLHEIYGQAAKDMKENRDEFNLKISSNEATNPFKNTDIRLSTYMTLKSLYDKWLCNPYNGPSDTWKLTKDRDSVSDFDSFIYIDSFYHDIGYKLTVNITKVASWLSNCIPSSNLGTQEGSLTYKGKTIYEFLAEVAQDCGGMLLALPQKFGLQSGRDIEQMFKPISLYDDWDDDTMTFVFMYTYKPSEHLGSAESSKLDMNGWSPEGDGLDLTDDELVGKLLSDNGYTIPAFGVTYAKQNQTIFKNIKLNTESAGSTEAGIAATFNIASKSSESPRESSLYGQDLYRVFSMYSYKCSAEMMGNMQITPLMYFQLNNIPLWKGAYTIIKVNHEITAGNITTNFEGIRVNRYAIPFADASVVTIKDDGTRSGSERVIGDTNPITGDNGRVLKGIKPDVNIIGNPNKKITDTIDFNERNITSKKPLICLTPAHGPKTQKKQEWEWSSKVVDKTVDILKGYKFSDGTSYAENIQRCNKDGNHTKDGYSMVETSNLIEKFGSDKVVSVVPHWNGGGGNYHMVMVNKSSKGTRQDSLKFAECMLTEIKKVKDKKDSFVTLPDKMLNGNCRIENLPEGNSDGAPQQKCACLLTENWFADFPSGCEWYDDAVYSNTTNDRYNTGRGWLMSKEGIETIARAHADGIKRYIDTL